MRADTRLMRVDCVGFVLYEFANVTLSRGRNELSLPANMADRASVYANATPVGTATRSGPSGATWPSGGGMAALRVLVENMGRVNFGPSMGGERKGMQGATVLNGVALDGPLTAYTLSMHHAESELQWARNATCVAAPCFYQFQFSADARTDTFLRFDGWSKVRRETLLSRLLLTLD